MCIKFVGSHVGSHAEHKLKYLFKRMPNDFDKTVCTNESEYTIRNFFYPNGHVERE